MASPFRIRFFKTLDFTLFPVSLGFGFLFLLVLNGFLRFQRETESGAKSLGKNELFCFEVKMKESRVVGRY